MKRYAVIKEEVVINVALWDGQTIWQPDGEVVELPENSLVGPGFTRQGSEWIAPLRPENDWPI